MPDDSKERPRRVVPGYFRKEITGAVTSGIRQAAWCICAHPARVGTRPQTAERRGKDADQHCGAQAGSVERGGRVIANFYQRSAGHRRTRAAGEARAQGVCAERV